MKKRFLSMFLAALMVFTALPALTARTDANDDLPPYNCSRSHNWAYLDNEDDTVTVIRGKGTPRTFIIPSTIDGKTVTATNGSFFGDKKLSLLVKNDVTTHVKISDSVINIGSSSFNGFPNLKKVTFGKNVEVIGKNAFCDCELLEDFTLPDSLTTIGHNAFARCFSLDTLTLPFGLTTIGSGAFYFCKSLTRVNIPDSVTTLSMEAFLHCYSLRSVTLGNGVNKIEFATFMDCRSLKSITIPASVTEIEEVAFDECTSLETVFYGGTREQWNSITVGEDNDALTSATVFYNHPAHSMAYIPTTATCTQGGAAAHYHCSLCGKDFLDEAGTTELTDQTAPALGHEGGDWVLTTPPTCTDAGEEKRLCERCGEYCDTRPVAALGHDYQPVSTTAPTCTENGFTTFVCSRCGHTYNSDGQSAPGHYFGDWTVTSAPTCTESGVETRCCSRCETVETRTVEPLGHSFGNWTETTAPTCKVSGEETAICTVCGGVGTRRVEPTGHSFTPWRVLTWESCTTDGEETRHCTVCGYVDTKVVAATGHSFVDGYCEYCCANDPFAPKIIVSDAWSKTRGDRIELTVSLEDNPGVSSLMLGLSYDENMLMLEDVANGELFAEISDFNPFDGGTGTVCFDSATNVTGDGVLMTLTFTINDEAQSDWYDVGVFVRAAYDENGDDVAFLWYEGIVDVIIYGDANGDGEVTGMDASLILQYAANYDDETGESTVDIPLACADVNGDGRITVMDASLILQYVANYDDETGTSTVVLGPTP